MTTPTNFKFKKVSNQYTRYFDIKKLLPKPSKKEAIEYFGRETVFNQIQRKPILKPRKVLKKPIQWVHTDNVVQSNKGSPYMLMSKDQSDDGAKEGRKNPICYNVMHEAPAPPPQEVINIVPIVRGIRISICVEHTRFQLVGKVSKNMGLTHVPEHRLWNIQWCDNTPHLDLLKSMKRFQQINHFPGMSEICRKDMLALNLNRMLKMYPGDYRIFPKTWLMPSDAYDVAIYANKHKRTYILKPYSSGQGRGIWLTNNLRSVGRQEKLICQTYVDRPLLIDGFKFDLRVYTLVTSVDPLRIFVYNEGLARFATHKYMPPALGNSNNVFMHLTNYCVNRRNSNYNAGKGHEGGSKRKLCEYNKWLKDHNYNVEEFWAAVDDAIIKTVISAWPVLKHNYNVCFPKHDQIQACFQLLGFDILVDWKLKPFILEVNHTPSLCGDETVDNEVKRPLIRDTLNLISSPLVDKEEIIRQDRIALRERLMRQQGKRRVPPPIQTGPDPSSRAAGGGELRQPCSIGALAQQIAWEESHLGNYRRIMPPTDSEKVNYYCKFYDQVKPTSMFKETTTSKTRMKLNMEHIRQQKLQEELDLEQQRQKRNLQERKLKFQKAFMQDTKASVTELQQKKQEALICKDIQRQQRKLLNPAPEKETINVWHTITNDQMKSKSNLCFRSKCSVNLVKTKRRQLRRQMLRRKQKARRLEWESQKDAEFLQKHGILRPAGAAPQSESSKLQITTQSKGKDNTKKLKRNSKANLNRSKANKSVTGKKSNRILNNWLPEPISVEEKQWQLEWRKKRTDALNQWQLKELLFTEMYERGHLTKNDIKLFPFLLYRILRRKTAARITDDK
ncbi:tubulin polyglutamylase ttll6 [Drosophila innubila]|uniref:tubulin polyglutamylase ttll6 n=1 Tax=Drosophila innubila TaxID=198719 RepID=UPI00148D3235|nr:tubulin polyglutamylase ttll6 [Drosophila innubila]